MKKILAIDDQKDNLITIKAVLKSQMPSCDVITALSGKEGIEIAREEEPDTILLDIIMPGMDGFEVCERLKADDSTKHIPVIMVTAIKTDSESRVKGLNIGADAFLSKPIDAIELSAQVNVMLRIKEAEDKLRAEKEVLKEDVSDKIIEIKKSEKKYRLMAENSIDIIWQMDLKLKFTYVSPSIKNVFGFTEEEWLGTYLYQHARRTEFIKMARHALGAIKDYKNFSITAFESKMLIKNGDELPVEIIGKILFNDKGFPEGIQGTTRDITERKKAEQLLRESESHLSSVMEAAKDVAFITTDLDGEDSRILSFSKGAENIFGYKAAEVIGKKVAILHPKKDVESFNSMQSNLRNEKSDSSELVLIRKSGEHFPAIFSHHALYNAEGNLNGTLGVSIDITERKLAEEALLTSEKLNKSITQTAVDAIISIKADGFILSWNKAAERIFGYTASEMLNKNLSEIILDKFKTGHISGLKRLKSGGSEKLIGKTVEITAVRKNGSHFPIELSLSTWTVENQIFFTGIIRDITERKHAEQIQKVLYNISQAAISSNSIEDLITIIQKQLGKIIDTKNFYIAFYDEKTDTFSSPFVSDEKDKIETWPAGKSFSAYVVKTGKSLLAKKDDSLRMREAGEIVNVGVPSEVWLGVPLFSEGVAKGVLAVQSYTNKNAYSLKDCEVLEFVASQISTSLERKNAEYILKESEERYRMLSKLTFEGIVLHENGIVVDINLSGAKMISYKHEEIVGKKVFDFLDKKDIPKVIENLEKSFSIPYEVTGVKKDGTKFPIEVEGRDVIRETDKRKLRVAALRDITERKKAQQLQIALYNISNAAIETDNLEELLAQIKIELGKIIDSTNFHVAFYDEKTDLISVPYFSNNEVDVPEISTGKTCTRYLINQKKSILLNQEELIELRKSNEIREFEADPLIWLGVPLEFEGKLIGGLAVQSYTNKDAYNQSDLIMLEFVSDQISIAIHRKRAEEELKAAYIKATESDRLKSAFLATMSHELRTPLNAIIGFSEFLNKELPVDDVERFGEIINTSGNHLLSIVNDLFDITLIEAGETKVRNEEVTLKSIFNDVYTVIEAKKKRDEKEGVELKLIFSEEKEDFSFNTDANKIKQILINLLKNAIKFTHQGYIHFGCEFISEQNKPSLKFYVKDSGIGIKEDKQKIIFDIFRQGEDSNTREYGGTGIGLSVAKRLAEILGGRIWLESEEGKGTTFYFTIPVEKTDIIGQAILQEIEPKRNNKTKTILIAEDDLMSYQFIEIVLNKLDVKLIWVKDGEDAIRYCKENSDIDLVLMDINLPVLNGYEATREIKQLLPDLPIIAQTAFAIAGDREKSLEAGCDDYISKPIKKEEFLEMISKYI